MARDLPIGNGSLLINYDSSYPCRDIYFSFLGQENEANDDLSHAGVWCAEGFSWIEHPELIKHVSYLPDSLITNVDCQHEQLGFRMLIQDGVDMIENVFLRKVRVDNLWDKERVIRLYFHLDLELYGNGIGDTIY